MKYLFRIGVLFFTLFTFLLILTCMSFDWPWTREIVTPPPDTCPACSSEKNTGERPECAFEIIADSSNTTVTKNLNLELTCNTLSYNDCYKEMESVFWFRYIPFSDEPTAVNVTWEFIDTEDDNYVFGVFSDCNDVDNPESCKPLRQCIGGGQKAFSFGVSKNIPTFFAVENFHIGAIRINIEEVKLDPGDSCLLPDDKTIFDIQTATPIQPTSQKKLPTGIAGCLTTTDGRKVFGWHWYKHTLSPDQGMVRITSGTKIPMLIVKDDCQTVVICQSEVTMDKPIIAALDQGGTFFFAVPTFWEYDWDTPGGGTEPETINIYIKEGACTATINGRVFIDNFETYQPPQVSPDDEGWIHWTSVSEYYGAKWYPVQRSYAFPKGEAPARDGGGDMFAHLFICGTEFNGLGGNVNYAYLQSRQNELLNFTDCSGAQIKFDFMHWNDAPHSIKDKIQVYYKSESEDWTLIENDGVRRYGPEGWSKNNIIDLSPVVGKKEVQLRLAAWIHAGGCCPGVTDPCPVEYYTVSYNIDNLSVLCCY